MTTIIERHRADIEALCRSYPVKRLDVFGSAIREDLQREILVGRRLVLVRCLLIPVRAGLISIRGRLVDVRGCLVGVGR
jgi:predicted nucleotidyltransferase